MAFDKIASAYTGNPSEPCYIDCGDFRPQINKLLSSITAHPHKQASAFLNQAAIAADSLPLFIRQRLLDFYTHGNREGVLLLGNCPREPGIDEIPTPTGASDKQSFVSEACLALFGARLGQIFGYVQIENGVLFQNIVPRPGMEREQSSACSLVELQFHTEQHFHPYPSDYVLLYCLRSSPGAATLYASVRQLTGLLDEGTRAILFQPLFRSGVDYAFGNTETRSGNGPLMSVLYGNRDDPFLRYDQDLMVGVSVEAQAALISLQQALEQVTGSVCLKPGELLILDNRRTVHGRSPFTPQYQGRDRWLQRAKIIRDIDRAAEDLDVHGYTVCTRFALD